MRASVLPFGADETQFYPAEIPTTSTEDPLIVYAGPLIPQSGVHVLLDAARLLTGRGINVRVLIIDRPEPGAAFDAIPTKSETEDYLRRLRNAARDNVWIEPYAGLEQVAVAMQSASVVVCPTLADEAFGLSNVQAMASGVPVAASCVGGIPEVFFEGGALLIPPADAIALANAIERLLGKTGIARLLRREGRESFLRNYCWPRIAAAYVELLEKLPVTLSPQRPALP
jgi:spore coat protein SA